MKNIEEDNDICIDHIRVEENDLDSTVYVNDPCDVM